MLSLLPWVRVRLPLYEGVDWNSDGCCRWVAITTSPSLRGSGLKLTNWFPWKPACVSLFTREWIEIGLITIKKVHEEVSLFTREWIEIATMARKPHWPSGLPLYEGVDWNIQWGSTEQMRLRSPSLRGSGLKYQFTKFDVSCSEVSLFTREWIEMAVRTSTLWLWMVSLFTREWIEIDIRPYISANDGVSLFTREWIEINLAED